MVGLTGWQHVRLATLDEIRHHSGLLVVLLRLWCMHALMHSATGQRAEFVIRPRLQPELGSHPQLPISMQSLTFKRIQVGVG